MILLDASALVAALVGEPATDEVRSLLGQGDTAIVSVNLTEALDVLVRVFNNDPAVVESVLIPLLATSLQVVSLGEVEARRGAEVRISHYHRKSCPISLADCLLLGTASVLGADIATTDGPIAGVARAEGLRVVPLKNSSGHRP